MEISQSWMDILQITYYFLTAGLLFSAYYQCFLNKKAMNSIAITEIYKGELRCRECYNEALIQVGKLHEDVKNLGIKPKIKDVELLFNGDSYEELRDFAYHYEFIGVLVKHNILRFNLVFDLIRYPDPFWDEAQPLMTKMREVYVKDFWKNAQDLQNKYHEKRKEEK